jgi:hypothetical protein
LLVQPLFFVLLLRRLGLRLGLLAGHCEGRGLGRPTRQTATQLLEITKIVSLCRTYQSLACRVRGNEEMARTFWDADREKSPREIEELPIKSHKLMQSPKVPNSAPNSEQLRAILLETRLIRLDFGCNPSPNPIDRTVAACR